MRVKISKQGVIFAVYAVVMLIPAYLETSISSMLDNILLLWAIWIVWNAKRKPDKFIILFGIYYIYLTIVSLSNGSNILDIHWIISVIKMIMFLNVVSIRIDKSARETVNILFGVVCVFLLLDFLSILLYPGGLYQSITVWNEWTSTSAAQWILGNKNNRCYWYFLGILLSIWRMKYEPKVGNKIIIYSLGIISLLAMIKTKSSTSIIATCIVLGAIYYGIKSTKKKSLKINTYIVFGIYILVQILILMGSLPFISSFVVRLFGKDLTFSGRTEIWTQILILIKQKPFLGWGQLSGETVGGMLGNKFFTSAHNQWLNTLFQGGIIFFVFVIAFFVWMIKKMNKDNQTIINMKILFLLAIFVDMLFESILSVFATWLLLYLIYKYPGNDRLT